MQIKISSWGNSQGVRIPKEILQEACFYPNDLLDIRAEKGQIILCKSKRHKSLEERAAAFGGQLLLDGEFDWGQPRGREDWS